MPRLHFKKFRIVLKLPFLFAVMVLSSCEFFTHVEPGSMRTQTSDQRMAGMIDAANAYAEHCDEFGIPPRAVLGTECDPDLVECKRLYVSSFHSSKGTISERYVAASKVERECFRKI